MDADEMPVRSWRITRGIPRGVHVWIDPSIESIRLFRAPTSGYWRSYGNQEGLAEREEREYLDKVSSVSAAKDEDDGDILEDDDLDQLDPGLPF